VLSNKSILFYPGIILSAGWTIINIVKIINFTETLHNEYPECTQPNPNRWAICIPTIIMLLIVKSPLEHFSTEVFQRVLPDKKFPQGSELRATKAQMLGERVFKLVINVTVVAVLYKILLQEDCNFLHVYLGGSVEEPLYY
jgi:hypothetical protein